MTDAAQVNIELPRAGRGSGEKWNWPRNLAQRLSLSAVTGQPRGLMPALGLAQSRRQAAVTPAITELSRDVAADILDGFSVSDRREIESYLRHNPYLGALLLQVRATINAIFESGVTVALDLFVDPESSDDELYALIQTDSPPQIAIDRLCTFDHEWWLEKVPLARGKLTVSLE